jgi:dolichyl-diphosphooligosaccharide--protein glycosyltransferase
MEEKKEEDITLNIDKDKLVKFIKKYNVFLLLLIPIFLSIYYRAYTYDLPITKDFAESSVRQNLQSQIQSQILQQAPDIDPQSLKTLVNQRTNEFIRNNYDQYLATVKQTQEFIKSNYQDDKGQTYLLAIDPYFYYRQAKNILDHGHIGDEIRNGKIIDNHMIAPNGKKIDPSLHPYVIVIAHKISSLFGNDSLMASAFIVPLIIMTLAVIPCFFIVKRLTGKLGALIASTIIAIHPAILSRTPAGFSDTDSYNVFFPLLILWLLIESFKAKNPKHKIILAGLAGISTGLFAFAWSAWWFFFDIVLGAIFIYMIFLLIKYKKQALKRKLFKNTLKISASYILVSAILVTLLQNFKIVINTITNPIKAALSIKQAAHPTLWPNVYTTVAELNEIPFREIISNIGGNLVVLLAILGPLLLLLTKKYFNSRLKYSLIVLLWLAAGLYTSTKGMRFIMLVIPAYAIGLGLTVDILYKRTLDYSVKSLKLNKILVSIILLSILIFLFQPMLAKADNQAKNEVPSFDDTWYTVLTNIKQKSQENAIITSWWDFGHWFKAIADRPVTFDGGSQNRPQAHWVGKLLLTSNEDESIAILRMLDCGGNDAYDLLLEEIQDAVITKRVIDQIILQDKETAKQTLSQYTNNPEKILEKTHCDPPEAFLITSEDMVSKSGVWAHFGSWSFERAYAYQVIKSNSREKAIEKLVSELNYTEEEASNLYYKLKGMSEKSANAWIAPYPGYMNFQQCAKLNETIMCQNGITIENNTAYANTNQGKTPIAYYRDDKNIYKLENGTTDFAVAYLPNSNTVVIMSPELLESIFTELFFYEGKNLEHFELFDHQTGFGQFDIYTWKVKWNSQ